MSAEIERYLEALRTQLTGCDPATIQDALSDAEDHIRSALDQAQADNPGQAQALAAARILEEYGSPEEVARAYREIETRLPPPFARRDPVDDRTPVQKFFGVVVEPRAYAALLYLLISIVTGTLYFAWAVTGASLSLSLIILIIGLPVFALFVFSLQGLALVEGRVVEALLGVRMPRRAPSRGPARGIWQRFLARLKDRRTWTTFFYLVIMLPLGTAYFSVFITLIVYGLQLILIPILQFLFNVPFFVIDDVRYFFPGWAVPLLMVAGFLEIILLLHLARIIGRWHGRLAKVMLVESGAT